MLQAETDRLIPLTQQERNSIETFYRAFTDKNPGLLDQAVTPDWQDIPLNPGQGAGPEGLKPLILAFIEAFPDMKVVVHEIFGSTGRAGVRAEIVGTHKGDWFGIAPTNKPIRIALHEFHYLKDGRLTHTWHLEDWYSMFNQVGAFPPARETMPHGSIVNDTVIHNPKMKRGHRSGKAAFRPSEKAPAGNL